MTPHALHTVAVALIAGGTITLLILLAAWARLHPRYHAARARVAARHAAPLIGRRRRLREARATRARLAP